MTRAEILETASRLVNGDREEQYSPPENSFRAIAELWSAYLFNRFGKDYRGILEPEDVGLMMTLFKIARIQTGSYKDDSYVDAAGYIACAGEIAAAHAEGGESDVHPH